MILTVVFKCIIFRNLRVKFQILGANLSKHEYDYRNSDLTLTYFLLVRDGVYRWAEIFVTINLSFPISEKKHHNDKSNKY